MLTSDQVSEFKRDGFVFGGRVLSDRQLADLRDGLARAMDGSGDAKPEKVGNLSSDGLVVLQIVNIWQAEPAFREHLYHPEIVEDVSQLMDSSTVRVWHDQVQLKPAGNGGPTVWHQDFPYWPVIRPASLVSAWVALEDATVENGAMSMVPRSHKWGVYGGGTVGINSNDWSPTYDPSFIPEGETVEIVPCEVPAGCVLFHHCLTWHGAPANFSSHPRPAIAVHYMPGDVYYAPEPGKTHLVEHHIDVAPGEPLKGSDFPTVLEDGKLYAGLM